MKSLPPGKHMQINKIPSTTENMKKRSPHHEKIKISSIEVVKNVKKVSFGLKNLRFKLNCQNYANCFIFETNLNLYF